MPYHILGKRLILNLMVLLASVASLFLANELFEKMPIMIIILAALNSSENFRAIFEEIIRVCTPLVNCFDGQFFSWKLLEKFFP